ncbi:hypothetical protein FS842_004253 [Serendipita sp. 407]|nr:hypothetical protein FS842_004253 [Serendipita sp. 407]
MKRLFGRKEKARPQRSVEPEEAKQASSLPTRPEAALESVHANETASNGLLSIDGASTSRSKSSFFSAVARGSSRTTMSTSGSDAGSTPVTTGSISGSSDGSSSAVSTRNDEPAGSRTAETATATTRRTTETSSSAPAVEEKGWPAWMSRSIGKGRAKKEQLQQQQPKPTASSFSNLSRSGTYGLGAALQAIQKGGENKNSSKTTTTSANGGRPSNRESSEVSEASEDSSWDELGDEMTTRRTIETLRIERTREFLLQAGSGDLLDFRLGSPIPGRYSEVTQLAPSVHAKLQRLSRTFTPSLSTP